MHTPPHGQERGLKARAPVTVQSRVRPHPRLLRMPLSLPLAGGARPSRRPGPLLLPWAPSSLLLLSAHRASFLALRLVQAWPRDCCPSQALPLCPANLLPATPTSILGCPGPSTSASFMSLPDGPSRGALATGSCPSPPVLGTSVLSTRSLAKPLPRDGHSMTQAWPACSVVRHRWPGRVTCLAPPPRALFRLPPTCRPQRPSGSQGHLQRGLSSLLLWVLLVGVWISVPRDVHTQVPLPEPRPLGPGWRRALQTREVGDL